MTHSTLNAFDAATAPLNEGVNLIEASAGTGKTFAIAMLALRFVAEQGLPLQQILVVTFTKAATEELRDRIRARLASARELLAGQTGTSAFRRPDPALIAWRAGLAQVGVTEELALARLEMALLDMDLAPVFTIHSFCQRMLQEQAMESGQLFDFELTTELSRWRQQTIHDYWRRTLYPLSPLRCALLTARFSTPDDLHASIRDAAGKRGRLEPNLPPVAELLDEIDRLRQELAHWWPAQGHTLRPLLDAAATQGLFKSALQEGLPLWWQQVDDFLAGGQPRLPDNLSFLSLNGITGHLNGQKFRNSKTQSSEAKKQAFLSTLPLPEPVISEFIRAWQDVELSLRAGLLAELNDQLPLAMGRRGLLCFDELITQLARSLKGPQGAELRRILGNRYRVALIDEFQDTDNDQFFIFSSLFAGNTDGGADTRFLYLIGDPKQAIYTFRGADIYSYFQARKQAWYQLNLAHNHRSHPGLVSAVNGLFTLRPNPFFTDELAYHPVLAAKKATDGQLLRGQSPLAVMVYGELAPCPDDKEGRWTSGKATDILIDWVSREILRLLDPSSPTHLQIADEIRPLEPRDVAILVRSHTQAARMQESLAACGIPVVMASQESVFKSPECHDLLLLLEALNQPTNEQILKTALTRPWFNLNGQELYALWQDPARLNDWLDRFHHSHQIWEEQGFLTMITRLLNQEQLLLNLARLPLPERRITNLHHLLELIQTEASRENMGPSRTLQWLQACRAQALDESKGSEDTVLRLESDEMAVRVLTMHAAKGLEYPVVFCPFLWYRSARLASAAAGAGAVTCHDANNGLVTDLGSPDFERRQEQALEEELAEELRLAYVALTRARCRCYALWADAKGSGRYVSDSRNSALAWLLSLDPITAETENTTFAGQVDSLRDRQPAGESERLIIPADPEGEAAIFLARQDRNSPLVPRIFSGRDLHTDWTLISYSSLSLASESASHHPSPIGADPAVPSDLPELPTLPVLPKGAALGNVVHGALEKLAFADLGNPARRADNEGFLRQQCSWFNVEADPAVLIDLLTRVVQTPLQPGGENFRLLDLAETDTLREMPFTFRLQPGSTEQINAILKDSPVTTPVSTRTIKGYLTGFIDLVCRHQGESGQEKFYIMDYKSNWLGTRLVDYGPERLTQAMREHNYGLQYWLYTLVLHRYLQGALPGYDYARHFGGVMYLFVRGMEPSQPGSGVFYDLPDFATLTRLDACLGYIPSAGGHADE